MSKIDLLPCPFCGKLETIRMIYLPTQKHGLVYHVVCDSAIGGCGSLTGLYQETQEEAAKEWNTRVPGWIPCSERMPEKDMSVLISAQGHRVTAYYDAVKGVFMLTETEGLFYSMSAVTHWMPLPEPPQRKDDTHDND